MEPKIEQGKSKCLPSFWDRCDGKGDMDGVGYKC